MQLCDGSRESRHWVTVFWYLIISTSGNQMIVVTYMRGFVFSVNRVFFFRLRPETAASLKYFEVRRIIYMTTI